MLNLIIGAGIAGLTLAQQLKSRGESVIVLEKSRGVGGRMATRREGVATFDHGAQFYVQRADFPHEAIWGSLGLVETWFEKNGVARKVCRSGMTKLAKSLALNDDLRLNTQVTGIERVDERWRVSAQISEGKLVRFEADRVFLSAPLPQSLDLLRISEMTFPTALSEVRYAKALVGLIAFEPSEGIFDKISYLENVSADVFSISNQQSKGVSAVPAFSIVMQPAWSEEWFDRPPQETLLAIQESFEKELRLNSKIDVPFIVNYADLKKWRYSHPLEETVKNFDRPYLEVAPRLFLMGDAFGGPSIGGACHSALAVFADIFGSEFSKSLGGGPLKS